MPRKRHARSKISRLPAEQRAFIERLLREDRLGLDEMLEAIRAQFPGEPAAEISRTGLGRYSKGVRELGERMREIEAASSVLVGEFGESIGDKAGDLLSQAVVTLTANAALRAQEQDEIDIDTIRKLAIAAKNSIDTKRISVNVRKAIRAEAREELLRDQREKLDAEAKEAGAGGLTIEKVRAVLGIG